MGDGYSEYSTSSNTYYYTAETTTNGNIYYFTTGTTASNWPGSTEETYIMALEEVMEGLLNSNESNESAPDPEPCTEGELIEFINGKEI